MTKKIFNILTYAAILALMSTMFAITVEPAKAAEQITIINHQGILDSTGYYNVVGEVKNTGDTAAKNVYVKITFNSNEGADEDEQRGAWQVEIREQRVDGAEAVTHALGERRQRRGVAPGDDRDLGVRGVVRPAYDDGRRGRRVSADEDDAPGTRRQAEMAGEDVWEAARLSRADLERRPDGVRHALPARSRYEGQGEQSGLRAGVVDRQIRLPALAGQAIRIGHARGDPE